MYIDTITPSLQAFTDSMNGLQEMKKNAIAQRLQKAQMLRDMGENLEAEKELRSARNYGLSSLLAPSAKGWSAEGAYKEPDAVFKQATDMQGGLLASMLDPTSVNYNPDQYDYMTRQKQGFQGLEGIAQLKNNNVDPFIQSDTATKMQSKVENFKRQVDDGTVDSNKNAEAFNKANSLYRRSYEGNETAQQQQLMDDTIKKMNNAKSDQERLGIYNKYYVTGKGIEDHYGHKFDAQPAAFFGIGGKKGGGDGKPEKVNIFVGGKKVESFLVPQAYLLDADPKTRILAAKKNAMARLGISDPASFEINFASSEDSGNMNPYQQKQTELVDRELDAMDKAEANKTVDKNNGYFTLDKTAREKANQELEIQGKDYRIDPETGAFYRIDQQVSQNKSVNPPVSQNQGQPTVNTSLWKRTK
jgi:hypothetical protein